MFLREVFFFGFKFIRELLCCGLIVIVQTCLRIVAVGTRQFVDFLSG